MDGPRPCVPTRARPALVLAWTLANLPALCLLLVVVIVRRLCAKDLPDRGIHSGLGCHGRHSHCDRHVGVARAGGEAVSDLWFSSEEQKSELQSLMRTSYPVFCMKKNSNKLTYCMIM